MRIVDLILWLAKEYPMPAKVSLRTDFTAADLRELAAKSSDANQRIRSTIRMVNSKHMGPQERPVILYRHRCFEPHAAIA